MVKVFIGYGGPEAEEVANSLNDFLKHEQLETFLASPKAHSLVSSTPNWPKEVEKNIIDCNIIIFVCHEKTVESKPAKKEIDFIFRNNLYNKMIIFSKSDDCIPKRARGSWHPLHFPPEKAEESFCRLLNEIFRSYIRLSAHIEAERIRGS